MYGRDKRVHMISWCCQYQQYFFCRFAECASLTS